MKIETFELFKATHGRPLEGNQCNCLSTCEHLTIKIVLGLEHNTVFNASGLNELIKRISAKFTKMPVKKNLNQDKLQLKNEHKTEKLQLLFIGKTLNT